MGSISDALRRAEEEGGSRQAAENAQGTGQVQTGQAQPNEDSASVVSEKSALAVADGGNGSFGARSEFADPSRLRGSGNDIFFPEDQSGVSTASPFPLNISALLRYKWTLVGVFLLVCVTSVPPIWLFIHPLYRATAIVRVSPVVPRILFKTEENVMVPLYQSYVNTQVSTILSPQVFGRVMDQLQVRQTSWYREKPMIGSPVTPAEKLRDALSVRPRPKTELIDVSMLAKKPGEAVLIVNAVVEGYKQLVDEAYGETDDMRFQTLQKEINAVKNELDGIINMRLAVSKQLGAVTPEEHYSGLSMRLNELEAELNQLERERAVNEWELEKLNDAVASRVRSSVDTGENDSLLSEEDENDPRPAQQEERKPRYADDAEWKLLKREREAVQQEMELARQRFGESHATILQLRSKIDFSVARLSEREAELEENWAATPIGITMSDGNASSGVANRETLRRIISRQKQQEQLLTEAFERQREKVSAASELARGLAGYEQKIAEKREHYRLVQDRLKQLEMESRAPARVGIASKAIPASRPDQDRRLILTVLAIGCALMASFAVGYVRTIADPTIKETSEVASTIQVPLLGELPDIGKTEEKVDIVTSELPESIRVIRTALLNCFPKEAASVVLLTSSGPKAGKTTVAVMLARSLAQLGKKVLLVDADIRGASLGRLFGVETESGLLALLTGRIAEEQVVHKSVAPNLDLLVSENSCAGWDLELLANGVFGACLVRWKRDYDVVILDGPPVLDVADARILAGHVDGTIMAVRVFHCRKADAIEAFSGLVSSGGRLLGTVLVGGSNHRDYGSYDDNGHNGTSYKQTSKDS